MPTTYPPRPTDATLSVTKAARLLGVHPNTIRTWSDAGRLRYFRINPRGDRRYRLGDLQRFLASAETSAAAGAPRGYPAPAGRRMPARNELDGQPAAVRSRSDRGADPLSAERRTAQDHARMAVLAAQLQSIQQLGVRLNRLSGVAEIGMAIATELRQLIECHDARVYRRVGTDLIPVARLGQVGESVDETPGQAGVKVGAGITGWVVANRIAQNLGDAATDPRANAMPGAEGDLDESVLLAPMLFGDQTLGVLVLSKRGLNQFTDDDLRLLEIYASFAAQAMANADATERLREQDRALER